MKRKKYLKNFRSNIEYERELRGLTQHEWAAKLGMSLSSYKRLLSGETSKVDFMFFERVYSATGRVMAELCGAHPIDVNLINKTRALPPQQLAFVKSLIDFEAALAADCVTVLVPVGNLDDGMVYDSANFEAIEVRAGLPDVNCGIRITSNHLHPVYHSGDVLLISNRAPRDGDVGIFIRTDTHRAYVRHFKQGRPCLLLPVNGRGESFEVDPFDHADMDKWFKFGVVVSKLRGV